MIKKALAWWEGLSGPVKGWIKGLVMATGAAATASLLQFLTAAGFNILAIDWRIVGGVALAAGVAYVQGHWQGLFTYPDGTPVYVAPQGSTIVKTDGSVTEVETPIH